MFEYFFFQEAQAYAEENSLLFMETSAKTAMNVNDIFLAIGAYSFLIFSEIFHYLVYLNHISIQPDLYIILKASFLHLSLCGKLIISTNKHKQNMQQIGCLFHRLFPDLFPPMTLNPVPFPSYSKEAS